MGYRSDVALCIKKEDYEVLKTNAEAVEYNILDSASTIRFDDEDGVVAIFWGCVKWYPEYEDVAVVENFIDELYDADKPFTFIRIGEERDDIEERMNWGDNGICDKIHLIRDIEFDI